MRRTARGILSVLALAAAPACGDAFGPGDVLGVWHTVSINGQAVPGAVEYLGVTHDTEYARWTFFDGAVCTLTQLVDGYTDTYDACDYALDLEEETISILFQNGVWDGTVDGSSMVLMDHHDIEWVLTKQ